MTQGPPRPPNSIDPRKGRKAQAAGARRTPKLPQSAEHGKTHRANGNGARDSSEQRFREFIDALPVAIYTTDAEGRLTHFNPAAVEVSGRVPDLGTDQWCVSWRLYKADGSPLPHDQCPMAIALKEGRSVLGEEIIAERPDGGRVWLAPFPSPIRDQQGRITGGINMLVDITARKRVEQERDHERELLRTIIDRIPVMVTQYDAASETLKVNRELKRVLGWSSAEPAGSASLSKGDLEPAIVDRFVTFLRSCQEGWTDLHMLSRDNREVVTSWANVRLSDGTEVGIGIDITHRQQAEQSLARRASEKAALFRFTDRLQRTASLQDVYQASLDAIFGALRCDRASILLFDQSGVMRFVAWRGLSERYRQAVQGHSPWRPGEQSPVPVHIPDIDTADIPAELKDSVRAEGIRSLGFIPLIAEDRLIGKFMIYFNAPHHCGEDDLALALMIGRQLAFGIERRRAEEERRDAEAALREANQRKDEFLATLAHELRNPLAPIRNSLEIIKRVDRNHHLNQQAHETIERQTDQLVRLVDDLLDVSRITHNTFELRKERVDLSTVFSNALETSGSLIAEGGQQLIVTLPPEPIILDVDPMRLAQVLSNLLNNAAKYSERGGRISFTAARKGEQVEVRIKDSGIGIAPELLPRIFDMFVQGDRSLERSRGGMGIGLTLVQRLVQMHGGSVEAHSDGLGKGSEFVVRLPIAADGLPGSPSEQRGADVEGRISRRILIADDNRDAAESLSTLLKLMGHEVAIAYDGLEAVEVAETFRPDVALLDLGMPRLNGYDTARRILKRHGHADLTLIALTGWGQEQDRNRTREAGFVHHLVKPLNLVTLQKLLDKSDRAASRHTG